MTRWEYLQVHVEHGASWWAEGPSIKEQGAVKPGSIGVLASEKWGHDGWELAGVVYAGYKEEYELFFKRPATS